MGEALFPLDGDLAATVFAGLALTRVVSGRLEMPSFAGEPDLAAMLKPRPVSATTFSWTALDSVAAAIFALSERRVLPRGSSSLGAGSVALGAALAGFSCFLATDFEREDFSRLGGACFFGDA